MWLRADAGYCAWAAGPRRPVRRHRVRDRCPADRAAVAAARRHRRGGTGPTRSTCPPRRWRWPTISRTGGRDPAADPPGPPRRRRRAGVGGSAGAVARLRGARRSGRRPPGEESRGGDAAQVGPGPAGPSASRRCQGCSAAVGARSAGCQRSSDSAWVTVWASNSAGSKSAASLSPSHSSLSSWPGWVGSVRAWASSA